MSRHESKVCTGVSPPSSMLHTRMPCKAGHAAAVRVSLHTHLRPSCRLPHCTQERSAGIINKTEPWNTRRSALMQSVPRNAAHVNALQGRAGQCSQALPASTKQPLRQPHLPAHSWCRGPCGPGSDGQRRQQLPPEGGVLANMLHMQVHRRPDIQEKRTPREKGTLVFCPTSLSSCTFLGAST